MTCCEKLAEFDSFYLSVGDLLHLANDLDFNPSLINLRMTGEWLCQVGEGSHKSTNMTTAVREAIKKCIVIEKWRNFRISKEWKTFSKEFDKKYRKAK